MPEPKKVATALSTERREGLEALIGLREEWGCEHILAFVDTLPKALEHGRRDLAHACMVVVGRVLQEGHVAWVEIEAAPEPERLVVQGIDVPAITPNGSRTRRQRVTQRVIRRMAREHATVERACTLVRWMR